MPLCLSYFSHADRFLVLHPTFKTDYMCHQEWPDSWIEQALMLIRQVWKANYAPRAQVPASMSTTTELCSGGLYNFNRYRKEKRVTATSDTIDQLEAYLTQDSFHVDDPLAYWNEKCASSTWPELAQMALDYLTIPATSVDVEHAFSCGQQTVFLYWHSLSSRTIHASLVFGDRCKQGLVIDDDLVKLLQDKRS
ncbi:hypothetical protein BOTBODRAFT_106379 [Botryobasidium botryosum FD-172 SS1]|uniref:HAT C-terminal dimerisation domain-containing protein n=1 Tax=Botryobasidium botryosum (strain FD-172 SS1) TaxID=930990 RepID=A0A067MMB6_BOTB1|nr:hypothetical protein BOTBODRAFT_106379 [Botryobasidium botryosum FD-172 SS1]